ncbi:MAG: RNA ligase family protein [Verrucomicrobiales bacterium]|nr:RNA ligase family protein [Verrucomicrobiales bacterium]
MTPLFKYPGTPHLPWSPGTTSEDRKLSDTDHFSGREIVVTEKMDGENTTMYRDVIHARSLDSRHHPSRDRVKALHASIAREIPEGWRLCGENLYARHSIPYFDLKSFFQLFSIWTDENQALSWDETLEWADLLGLTVVPVLYRGDFDAEMLKSMQIDTVRMEGYVVRTAETFAYQDFSVSVAKWVREGHVQTDQHWMFAEIIPNELAENNNECH